MEGNEKRRFKGRGKYFLPADPGLIEVGWLAKSEEAGLAREFECVAGEWRERDTRKENSWIVLIRARALA